ncbi:FAD-dependent oxidoreductase [Rickettsiella grylli]|uniref:Tryptophan 2-monooxygenase n=1 Tax=Rickettsiella grylli TaxID=59196 RepID=A8PK65_9COXI|nr:FAD-dependent oxidoreductase [Rickettsiella grylli]EDP46907.1 amine oxidase [Rickettsiella grylli]
MSRNIRINHRSIYDVIIVGGGISGLAAADYLITHGKRVLLLEATNRIGGRILSLPYFEYALDLGASWIHGIQNNPIAKIANDFNIKTSPTVYSSQCLTNKFNSQTLFNSQGKIINASQIAELLRLNKRFENFLDKMTIIHDKNKSLEDALNFFCNHHSLSKKEYVDLKFTLRSLYAYEFGDELNRISVNVEQPYNHSVIAGENVLFPFGYAQVLTPFLKKQKILLSRKVKKIVYSKKEISIVTNHGEFLSKQVIISVSLGVLKSNQIEFIPQLPDWKKYSIFKLGFNAFNKIYLIFNHVFWDKDKEWIAYMPDDENINKSFEIMNYYKFTGLPILCAFGAGDLARTVETWPNEEIISHLIMLLNKLYHHKNIRPISYFITRWIKNSYQRGSFTYLPFGVDPTIFAVLARPIDNKLFFSGEATSVTDPGTVHGAYLSGIEAAKQILML